MAITLASLLKNKEAISKEVPYNVEKMNYNVRLPEKTKDLIVFMRDVERMHIQDIAKKLDISAATVRKVLIQNGCELGNLNLKKD